MNKAELEAKIKKLKDNKFIPESLKSKAIAKHEAQLEDLKKEAIEGAGGADEVVRLHKRVKEKSTKKAAAAPAYKGKPVKELNAENCKELIGEVKKRRQEAAKSSEKSRTRPVVEKTVSSIATGVKHAIKNVSAEDIKDNPTKELGKIDKAIALTKKFAQDLKGLLGEDYDAATVNEELKPLVDLSKELHKKYDA